MEGVEKDSASGSVGRKAKSMKLLSLGDLRARVVLKWRVCSDCMRGMGLVVVERVTTGSALEPDVEKLLLLPSFVDRVWSDVFSDEVATPIWDATGEKVI